MERKKSKINFNRWEPWTFLSDYYSFNLILTKNHSLSTIFWILMIQKIQLLINKIIKILVILVTKIIVLFKQTQFFWINIGTIIHIKKLFDFYQFRLCCFRLSSIFNISRIESEIIFAKMLQLFCYYLV